MLHERDVRQRLPPIGRGRQAGVLEAGPHAFTDQHGEAERSQQGKGQAQIALPDQLQGLGQRQRLVPRQTARREKTRTHQEELHRQSAMVIQPADQLRPGFGHHIRHGSIKRQVVQHDQQTACGFDRIDQKRTPRRALF